jgi:hypothetical protein
MTHTITTEAETLKSINGYREMFPDATREELVQIQSDAMKDYRRVLLSDVAMGASFSIAYEVAKSVGRNDG